MYRTIIMAVLVLGFNLSLLAQQVDNTQIENDVKAIVNFFQTEYCRPLSNDELLLGVTEGFKASLDDPYIEYYTPSEYKLLKEEMEGKYQGIGIIVKQEEDKILKVIGTLSQGPGEKAGIKTGDIILTIDGEKAEIHPLAELVKRLRGPKGSKVNLKISRPATNEELNIEVVREEFSYRGFTYKMFPEGIFYVKFNFFHKGIASELQKAMEEVKDSIKGMIIDMRGCHGGVLEEVLSLANIFLAPGPVFQLKTREKTSEEATKNPAYFEKPIVVLTNKETASGAELIAGALKDRDRGILIGEKTYGKGSVQKIFELPSKGAVKITVAHYLTPKGNVVDKKGIEPDICISGDEKQIEVAKSIVKVMAEKGK